MYIFSTNKSDKLQFALFGCCLLQLMIYLQVDEEIAKLLELKAQVPNEDGPAQKFVLKTPKVRCCIFTFHENKIATKYFIQFTV